VLAWLFESAGRRRRVRETSGMVRFQVDIVIDRFTDDRISGWVRGLTTEVVLEMRLGPDIYPFSASLYRPDLPCPTAFINIFSQAQIATLGRGVPLGIYVSGAPVPLVELKLGSAPKPVAFVLPAGEVSGRDSVRWYGSEDPGKSLFHYHNIGDSFVYDSSLKIIDALSFFIMDVSKYDEGAIANVNENCSAVVLRGSNYFHHRMDWGQAEQIFDNIKVPIICLGIGIQAPDRAALALTAKQLRILMMLGDKANSIGVRGYRTAEELNGFGIKNVDIIGCPTLFRNRIRDNFISNLNFQEIESLAFNIRREVSDAYSHNAGLYTGLQRQILDLFVAAKDVTLMAHGEVEEKIFAQGRTEIYEYVIERLVDQNWFRDRSDPLIEIYKSKLFYSDSVANYDAFVKNFPLVTGYRLHGNLMALANGVPSFYFVYDERTLELCETFHIPFFDVRGPNVFSFEMMNEIGSFDAFNAHYPVAYQRMIDFLEKNGLPHRL
jgi:Polysaccharide pyruvyl transferase